jgi:hypothetical protein
MWLDGSGFSSGSGAESLDLIDTSSRRPKLVNDSGRLWKTIEKALLLSEKLHLLKQISGSMLDVSQILRRIRFKIALFVAILFA